MKYPFYKWTSFLVVILAVFLLSIHLYAMKLASKSTKGVPKECTDYLNKTLFRVELRLCFWNGIHIVLFFLLCYWLKPTTLVDHLGIFGIGVIWFLLQMLANSIFPNTQTNEKEIRGGKQYSCPTVSYPNVMVPRMDDFVYNTLGQIIYIVATLSTV